MRTQEPPFCRHFSVGELSHSNSRLVAYGKQSRVYSAQFVIKQIGQGRELSHHEATKLATQLCEYQQVLRGKGWLLPDCHFVRVDGNRGEFSLTTYEQYIRGPSLTDILMTKGIRTGHVACRPIFRLLCTEPTVELVYEGTRLHRLGYGVDLKPDNLVLSAETGELFLVDTFAPKLLDKSGAWRYYSQKFDTLSPDKLMVVTATREGVILRLLRLMGVRRNGPGYKEILALLETTCIDQEELGLIRAEVDNDYPTLNSIYSVAVLE